jgi:hypothetical protein
MKTSHAYSQLYNHNSISNKDEIRSYIEGIISSKIREFKVYLTLIEPNKEEQQNQN